jgi:hypothetical protein
MFTEEKEDEVGVRLEYSPQKLLRYLVQETDIAKSSTAEVTKLLKFKPYKMS